MLIGFTVNNYRSFDTAQSISFIASKIARHREHVAQIENKKVLKSGLIFGANASGKSNLIKAVDFSRRIILHGLEKVDLNKQHFRINNDAYLLPGIFEYRLMVDKKEYSYGIAISYSSKEVISEWLVRVEKNGIETYIFNRNLDENNVSIVETEVKFGNKEDKMRMNIYLEDFGKNISEAFRKKTILSDIALRSNEKEGILSEILSIYNWFRRIIILFPTSKYGALDEVAVDDEKRIFFSKVMNYFDTGIQSINSKSGVIDFDKIFDNISKEDAEKTKIDISNALEEHPIMLKIGDQLYSLRKDDKGNVISSKMVQNHGNQDDMFEYIDESDGTKRLFDLVPLFYEKRRDSVILIDEIDRSLHTNLTKQFLELFFELTQNATTQIIATTHDSNLLDLELMRQDEIWFVERQDDHSSSIFSLNRFKERYDKRIDKEYLLGRYGAIPMFGNEELIMEELDDK